MQVVKIHIFLSVIIIIQAKEWIKLFTSLGGTGHGYRKENVTPYMHVMVYHVPYVMRKHSGIRKSTGQGKTKQSNSLLHATVWLPDFV